MSTLDSQLLTVSSIIIRDMPFRRLKTNSFRRLLIALIALSGLLIAVNPPDTILEFINKTSFNGLAVLAPTVIGGLYWRRGNRYGALSSIATGELMVVLFYFDLLSTPQLLPVIPIMLASFAVYTAVSLLTHAAENISLVFTLQRRNWAWAGIFGLFFLLGNDFWNWNQSRALLLGLPGWIWYFILLGVLLSGAFALYSFGKPHFSKPHFSKPHFGRPHT